MTSLTFMFVEVPEPATQGLVAHVDKSGVDLDGETVAGGADVEMCLGQAGILSQRSKLGETFLDPGWVTERTAGSIGGSKVAS